MDVSLAGWAQDVTTLARMVCSSQWTAVFASAIQASSVLDVTANAPATARSWEGRASVSLDGVGRFVIILAVQGLVRTALATVNATTPCMNARVIMDGLETAVKFLIVLETLTV